MAIDVRQFELDRLINMMKSFEWGVIASSLEEKKVVAQMEKVVAGGDVDKKKFEMDRITNMLRSFGWSVTTSSIAGDKVALTLEKLVTPSSA